MITKEQVHQWIDEASEKAKPGEMLWHIAQRAAAHGAAERERENEAALKEWLEKTEWVQTNDLPVKYLGWHRADVLKDMIAAARLQGAEEERKRAEQDLKDRIKKTAEFFGSMHGNAEDAYIEQEAAHGIGVKEQTT